MSRLLVWLVTVISVGFWIVLVSVKIYNESISYQELLFYTTILSGCSVLAAGISCIGRRKE